VRSNQSEYLWTALGPLHSNDLPWAFLSGSSRAKLAFPCFRTRPSSACNRRVPRESDVRSTEHRPWLEPVMATTSSVSARIGAQTSWHIQLYTRIRSRTKCHTHDSVESAALRAGTSPLWWVAGDASGPERRRRLSPSKLQGCNVALGGHSLHFPLIPHAPISP
jgi:hypothetical protein